MASLDQIRKMLLGEITNWEDLGGPNLPVKVVLVGGGGGVTSIIETKLLQGRRAAGLHVIYVKTPVQVIKVIQQLPGAIGFAQLALTKSQGLPELVTDQTVEQTLSLVTLGSPTPPMSDVIRASRLVAERTM
jgi:ABC-type phosphate transport system substrate-binding protein